MTSIVRKLWSFTAILIFSVTVNADSAPKKVGELDLKEMTGKDAVDFLNVYVGVSGNIQDLFFINVIYYSEIITDITDQFRTQTQEVDFYYILRDADDNFLVLENILNLNL